MPGKAVDEIVLASVRFVSDDDDVPPVGKHGVLIAFLFRQEFLNGRENDAAGVDLKFPSEVGPAFRLHGRLAKQLLTAGESTEELVVEIVPIRQNHQGRIRHCRFEDHSSSVKCHREALPRTLRVPDHADAPVARRSTRLLR